MTFAPVEIRELSPALRGDFLAFFEGEAFADNPKWAFCYCQFLYVDHATVNWPARSAASNRAAACGRIDAGRMQGLLAYREGRPVGWCNAAPRLLMDALADEPDPDAAQIGRIGCFVVAKAHRRSGVARALLDAACSMLARQGLTIAEATPLAQTASDAQAHYGPIDLYLDAGFRVHHRDDEGRIVVRRKLP